MEIWQYSNSLTKLLSSGLIKNIYPMVDKIDAAYYVNEKIGSEVITLDILINDLSINKDNMYGKDFDPHYLVDFHVRNLLPFLDLSKNIKIFTTVYNKKGKEIVDFGF